jgi:hypothetical protein
MTQLEDKTTVRLSPRIEYIEFSPASPLTQCRFMQMPIGATEHSDLEAKVELVGPAQYHSLELRARGRDFGHGREGFVCPTKNAAILATDAQTFGLVDEAWFGPLAVTDIADYAQKSMRLHVVGNMRDYSVHTETKPLPITTAFPLLGITHGLYHKSPGTDRVEVLGLTEVLVHGAANTPLFVNAFNHVHFTVPAFNANDKEPAYEATLGYR